MSFRWKQINAAQHGYKVGVGVSIGRSITERKVGAVDGLDVAVVLLLILILLAATGHLKL